MADQKWANHQTHSAWTFFTDDKAEGRLEYTQQYVERVLGVALAGKVRLLSVTELSPGEDGLEIKHKGAASESATALSLLAMNLSRSFGGDAPEDLYDLDTWPGHMAFNAALAVDWHQVADRLLRKFTLEYVPGEAA